MSSHSLGGVSPSTHNQGNPGAGEVQKDCHSTNTPLEPEAQASHAGTGGVSGPITILGYGVADWPVYSSTIKNGSLTQQG
jgi:hypothetical protein